MKIFFRQAPVKFASPSAGYSAPPQTMASCEKLISAGADVICLDVGLTSDKRLVAAPNLPLHRISDGSGELSRSTYDEVRRLDAGYQYHFNDEYPYRGMGFRFQGPEDFLSAFPEQRFNIHINGKDPSLAGAFMDLVSRTGSAERILASSLSFRSISSIRKRFPEMATTLSMPEVIGFYALFRTGLLFFKRRFSGDALLIHEVMGISYFGSQALTGAARRCGLKTYFLDVNDAKTRRRLTDAGADGFVTGDPELFKAL